MNARLVCSLFVDARALSGESLADVLASCERVGDQGLQVEARERKPEEIVDGREFPDDFFGFPLVIELHSSWSIDALVDAVALMLRTIWSHGARAVASCDFEDRLPHAGGLLYRPQRPYR